MTSKQPSECAAAAVVAQSGTSQMSDSGGFTGNRVLGMYNILNV